MSEKTNAGPVSGEIMSDRSGRAAASRSNKAGSGEAGTGDIVDAEYETVGVQPPPRDPDAARHAPSGKEAASGFDMLRPDAAAGGSRGSSHAGPAFWTFGLVAVALAFWVSGGYALVGKGPLMGATRAGTEPALRIASLKSRVETRGSRSVLLVDGEAVNGGERVRTLPKLSINVLGKDGATTHYFLGTNKPALAPGEAFTFSSRLVAPKHGVESVSVTIGENED